MPVILLSRSTRRLIAVTAMIVFALPLPAVADEDEGTESYAIRGQATGLFQYHPTFSAAYTGPNSLDPRSQHDENADVTLYAGYRPWDGAELWIDPEVVQGFALSDAVGAAGYVNGEASKVGAHRPYFRITRLFLRQTIDLGDTTEHVEADQNQLAGNRSTDHIAIWAGKFAVTDVFDTNQYANNPKSDFLNWSIINTGTFDYAADAWGYSYGTAVEWYQDRWALRTGLFNLSTIPNNKALDTRLFDQYQGIVEVEERHTIGDLAGKIRFLWYDSIGRLGAYSAAIAYAKATDTTPSTGNVREMHSKQGIGLNGEQQITGDLGVFLRTGWSQGQYEADEFTDINKTICVGLSLMGARWTRPDDTVGLAFAMNGISEAGKQYLAAGGLGIEVGDGQLPNSAAEQIVESYYNYAVTSVLHVSIDYQYLRHPAYSADRGPASIFAARAHVTF